LKPLLSLRKDPKAIIFFGECLAFLRACWAVKARKHTLFQAIIELELRFLYCLEYTSRLNLEPHF